MTHIGKSNPPTQFPNEFLEQMSFNSFSIYSELRMVNYTFSPLSFSGYYYIILSYLEQMRLAFQKLVFLLSLDFCQKSTKLFTFSLGFNPAQISL